MERGRAPAGSRNILRWTQDAGCLQVEMATGTSKIPQLNCTSSLVGRCVCAGDADTLQLQRDFKAVKEMEAQPGFVWDRSTSRLNASQEAWDHAENVSCAV